MNFLCDRCKQKYHVADEKVRGRAVTRFKCKKCENIIELRLGSGAEGSSAAPDDLSSAPAVPASVPPPPASAAPRPAPSMRASIPPVAPRPPTGTGLPTAGSALRAPTNAPLPTRPQTGVGMSTAAANAIPRPATGTGLPSAPRAAPPAPRAPTGSGLPAFARAMAPAHAPRPATGTGLPVAPSKANPPASSPLRSGLGKNDPPSRASSTASALLNAAETGWYAGVRDLPVGPLTRTELAAKIESGDITPDSLVWREGLDDWRPLQSVAELSDLLRHAAQKMSDGLLGTMGRRDPPAPGGKVVPIAQARTGGARGFETSTDDIADDKPTRMTSLADLVAKSEEVPSPSVHAPRPAPPATAKTTAPATPSARAKPAAPPAKDPLAAAAPAPKPSAAAPPPPATATASSVPVVAPTPAPAVAPAPTFAAPPATAAVAAKPSPAALAGPNEPTVNVEPSAPFTLGVPLPTAPAPAAAPAESRRRGGAPMGMWILMAGVGVFGIAVGIFLRPSTPAAPTSSPAPARTTPPPADPPVSRSVAAEIRLPADPPTPPAQPPAPAPTQPTQPATPVAANAAGSSEPRHSVAATAGTRPPAAAPAAPAHTLSAAQLAAINALGAQSAGVAQSSGPTSTQLRNTPQPTDSAGGGLTGQARAGQVIEALRRSNVVDSCWTAAQRRNPAHPAEQIRVQMDVLPTGRAARVSVMGSADPDLATCIQNRARANPYGSGGEITAEASFSLVSGQ